MDLEKICTQSIEIVKQTGRFIQKEVGRVEAESIEEKSMNSLVSYVDREAESRLVDGLGRLLPDAAFVTEEDTVDNQEGELQWIIDPLDGTTNFLHQLPCFSISVALQREGQTVMGIVYEINQRECFYAWEDSQAFLNGRVIRVSSRSRLSEALVATGFPYHDYSKMRSYFKILEDFMQHTRGIRRFGSAAVDLAYVACGRYDAFFEYSLNAWDVAGGAFLVQAAGGRVSDFRGEDDYLYGQEIIAASPSVFDKVQQIVGKAFYPDK